MTGDIHDLLRRQRALLRMLLSQTPKLPGSIYRDVDECDRLADLIQRRAEDVAKPKAGKI